MGSSGEAEEVVQEAFWRAWRNAARWRPGEAAFSTWLHRVVINLCIDRERRARLRRALSLEAAPEPAAPDIAADERLVATDELSAVLADIRRLPARQRAAVLLAGSGEHSNAGIAAAQQARMARLHWMMSRFGDMHGHRQGPPWRFSAAPWNHDGHWGHDNGNRPPWGSRMGDHDGWRHGPAHGAFLRMWLRRADTDHDGALSKAEAAAADTALFKRLDANHDGSITKDELKRALAWLGPHRGHDGNGWHRGPRHDGNR